MKNLICICHNKPCKCKCRVIYSGDSEKQQYFCIAIPREYKFDFYSIKIEMKRDVSYDTSLFACVYSKRMGYIMLFYK